MRFMILYVLSHVWLVVQAQPITGRVVDQSGKGVANASITLLKDSVVLVMVSADSTGIFHLQAPTSIGMMYRMYCSALGYRDTVVSFRYPDTGGLQRIVLQHDDAQLAAVEVVGKRLLLQRHSDRTVVMVDQGPLAHGLSALEVLQRSPGVWVDNLGTIRLKGTQAVTVMINDVVQRLEAEELADLLRALKSEDISTIDIIPQPPAEFEAGGAGGILHIRLKKSKKKNGNGTLTTQYWQQGRKPYASTGISLSRQVGKFYLSGNVSVTRDRRAISEETAIRYPDQTAYRNVASRWEKIDRQQYRMAAAYDIAPGHSISLQANYAQTVFLQQFNTEDSYTKNSIIPGVSATTKKRRFRNLGGTLAYVKQLDSTGGVFKLIADYSVSNRSEDNLFFKTFPDSPDDRRWRNRAPIGTNILTVQADLDKTLKNKYRLTAGIKYARIERDNQLHTEDLTDGEWTINARQSSRFLYTEQLWMTYSSLEKTFGKTTVKAGLRAEQTMANGHETMIAQKFQRHYLGWFPSLNTTYALGNNSIGFSYVRRLTRPSLSDLNPARLSFSNYTSVTGNPNLLPQYSQHIAASFLWKQVHQFELYQVYTRQFISLSAYPGDDFSIDYHAENTGSTKEWGFSYSSSVTLMPWWTLTSNVSAFRLAYRFNNTDYRQISYSANTLHSISLGKTTELDLVADYRSPFIYTNLYTYGNFSMDLGVTRKLSRNKARLRLAITDVFNTSREREWTYEQGTGIAFYRKRPTRTARIVFTWAFHSGSKNTQRQIDTGGAEEKGRAVN